MMFPKNGQNTKSVSLIAFCYAFIQTLAISPSEATEKLDRFKLVTATSVKCKMNLKGKDEASCLKAVRVMIEEMNCTHIVSETRACYVNRLFELLSDAGVVNYIRSFNDRVEANDNFSLWDFTLQKTNGDSKKALEWIAVLFQDLDQREMLTTHINYLYSDEGSTELNRRNISQEVVVDLQKALYYIEHRPPQISIYPSGVEENWGRHYTNLYHFYTPAYLASRLMDLNLSAKDAFIAPYIFNYTYEVVDQFENAKPHQIEAVYFMNKLVRKKDGSNSDRINYGLLDIAVGTHGAEWALGIPLTPFSEQKEMIEKNPVKFLEGEIKKLNY